MSLFKLPPEVRQLIFRNIGEETIYVYDEHNQLAYCDTVPPLGMFLTCKRLGEEARQAYYGTKVFQIVDADEGPRPWLALMGWLELIGTENRRYLRYIEVNKNTFTKPLFHERSKEDKISQDESLDRRQFVDPEMESCILSLAEIPVTIDLGLFCADGDEFLFNPVISRNVRALYDYTAGKKMILLVSMTLWDGDLTDTESAELAAAGWLVKQRSFPRPRLMSKARTLVWNLNPPSQSKQVLESIL